MPDLQAVKPTSRLSMDPIPTVKEVVDVMEVC
jgi:hypothetical protein